MTAKNFRASVSQGCYYCYTIEGCIIAERRG